MHVLRVFLFNVIPVFCVVGAGYLFGRTFKPHLQTLSKLGFFFLLPPFVFVLLYERPLPPEAGRAFLFGMILMALLWGSSVLFARGVRYSREMQASFTNAVIFSNTGNIGIPLVMLIFSSPPFVTSAGEAPWLDKALAIQIMIWLVHALGLNSVGFFVAGSARESCGKGFLRIFRIPTIYAVVLAFFCKRYVPHLDTLPLWPAFLTMRNAFVAVALLTLGVQLSRTSWSFRSIPMYGASFFRLVLSPLFALGLIGLMHFSGVEAQVLFISSALPTAVVSALIAVEYDLHPDFAANSVMCSTVLSALLLPLIVVLGQNLFPWTP